MPVIYSNDTDDDEQLVRDNRSAILTSEVVHVIDPDTQFAREQKRKKQQQEAALENARMMKRLELQEQREIEIAKLDNQQRLLERGWKKWPAPHERFYSPGVCDICNVEVMYLDANSPHITTADYPLNAPYDKEHKDDIANYTTKHICSTVTSDLVRKLWSAIGDLNQRLSKHDERERSKLYMPVG